MNRDGTEREPAGRRLDVLRALRQAAAPLSIAEIAERVGVHPNTARFHLEILVENGQVERVTADRRAPGRPPRLFRAVRGMDPTGPRHYRLLAEILVQQFATHPNPAERAVAAGHAWGRRLGATGAGDRTGAGGDPPVARLVELLQEWGFAPERRAAEGSPVIGLRHCPFLELAGHGSEIVCPVHLGLMRGAMEAWGSPLTVDRLEPFAEPDLCLAHLATGEESRWTRSP